IGMIVGAALYAETYPALKTSILTWGNYGKITIPQALGINPWFVIALLIVLVLLLFRFFERKNL
ncbi:MAG: YeeE/YedE family protein, partial [Desulfohalobiaceae bacterium]